MAEGRQTQLFTDRLGHVRNGRRVGRARGHRFGAAALDRLSNGRALFNLVTGSDPQELAGDGVFLDHSERYEASAEFTQVWRSIAIFTNIIIDMLIAPDRPGVRHKQDFRVVTPHIQRFVQILGTAPSKRLV